MLVYVSKHLGMILGSSNTSKGNSKLKFILTTDGIIT
jgi:hypothetical protein